MSCDTSLDIYQNLPDEVDLEIKRGQSWSLPVTLTDSATGSAIDITGYTGFTTFKKDDGTLILNPTFTLVSAALGEYIISLTLTQTLALPLDTLIYWDSFLSNGTTSIPIFEGTVVVHANYATPS